MGHADRLDQLGRAETGLECMSVDVDLAALVDVHSGPSVAAVGRRAHRHVRRLVSNGEPPEPTSTW